MNEREHDGQPREDGDTTEVRHRYLLHLQRARVIDDAGPHGHPHRDRCRGQRDDERRDHGHVSTCDAVPLWTSMRVAGLNPHAW